jgi:hypothetical protein
LLRARGARDYQPAAEVLPVGEALPPRPRQVNRLLEKLGRAKCRHRRGPRRDRRGAQAEVEELAERTGALLATTLPARGHPCSTPLISGGKKLRPPLDPPLKSGTPPSTRRPDAWGPCLIRGHPPLDRRVDL